MQHRVKHAVQAQNVFRHIVRNAEHIGMKVNTGKTSMVCFSDASAYRADAFIEDADGNRLRCQDGFKALGMRFSNSPDMSAHVDWIVKSMRSCLWILRNLKRSRFTSEELVKVYSTMLRPVAEYCCVVYHSSLTDRQDEQLERMQNLALKCIYGPFISARKMRKMFGLQSLRGRRIELCDKFAKKSLSNPRFSNWFPMKTTWASARGGVQEPFLEEKAQCTLLQDSPVFYFRRRLNGKQGKNYGQRYAECRE